MNFSKFYKDLSKNRHFNILALIILIFAFSNLIFMLFGFKFIGKGMTIVSIFYILISYLFYLSRFKNRFYRLVLFVMYTHYINFGVKYLYYVRQTNMSDMVRLTSLLVIFFQLIWLERTHKCSTLVNIICLSISVFFTVFFIL